MSSQQQQNKNNRKNPDSAQAMEGVLKTKGLGKSLHTEQGPHALIPSTKDADN